MRGYLSICERYWNKLVSPTGYDNDGKQAERSAPVRGPGSTEREPLRKNANVGHQHPWQGELNCKRDDPDRSNLCAEHQRNQQSEASEAVP